jgi:hypothetical protein
MNQRRIASMRNWSLMAAVSCSVILSATAPPAHAFDLTGHWAGKYSCKNFDGVKYKSGNKESTLAITQTGTTLAVDLNNGAFLYNGAAIFDVSKPDVKGEVVLNQCGTDNLPAAGAQGEIVRATVKTKLDDFKASFKALSIYEDEENGAFWGTCKYSFKRTDQTDPQVGACP